MELVDPGLLEFALLFSAPILLANTDLTGDTGYTTKTPESEHKKAMNVEE